MGKNQYGANALYTRASEHAGGRGGYKKVSTHGGILPFDCCSLTFSPCKVPVALCEASNCYIFDLANILPWLKTNKVNPVTGKSAAISDLVKLKIHRNNKGVTHCPVTFKVLNKSSHIVCVKVPGCTLSASTGHEANVYAFEAVRELCIKPKKYIDPLSSLTFTREDVLLIQDPKNTSGKLQDRSGFYHAQLEKQQQQQQQLASSSSSSTSNQTTHAVGVVGARSSSGLLVNSATARVFAELESQRKKKQLEEDSNSTAASSTSSSSSSFSSFKSSNQSNGAMAGGFTSSSMAPTTTTQFRNITTLESLQKRWRKLQSKKKDGLINIITSQGTMVFQLFYTTAPAACDNFVTLCEQGYYNNVAFHRLIKGFMLQGGDPTGTGRGSGKTAWEGVSTFPDEPFDRNHTHSSRGTLSMANSGPNTNGTQFFITFKATPHLDRKHTVFGKLLSGLDVLERIEQIPANDKDVPSLEIKIISTNVKKKPMLDADKINVIDEEEELRKQVSIEPRMKVTSSTAIGSFMKQSQGKGKKNDGNSKRKRASSKQKMGNSRGNSGAVKKKKMSFDGW